MTIQYDHYRQRWEKRLTRYLSWHWRVAAKDGQFVQTYRVSTLLEAAGETVNTRYPSRTRDRLEKALDTLQEDHVIAGWQYARWDEETAHRQGWRDRWLTATIAIEAPDAIKDHYKQIAERAATHAPAAIANAATNIGDRIQNRRKELGLTQLQVAEQIGIKQGHLSRIERGAVEPFASLAKTLTAWVNGA